MTPLRRSSPVRRSSANSPKQISCDVASVDKRELRNLINSQLRSLPKTYLQLTFHPLTQSARASHCCPVRKAYSQIRCNPPNTWGGFYDTCNFLLQLRFQGGATTRLVYSNRIHCEPTLFGHWRRNHHECWRLRPD